jgi:hypothetical protein
VELEIVTLNKISQIQKNKWASVMANAYNPSYLEDRDQKYRASRTVQEKS